MSESDQRLWGDETEKAVANFPVSGHPVPAPVIQWLGRLKAAAARTNADLGLLDGELAERIARAGDEVAAGDHDDQFPVDVFQTGSGTSSNMNANEVIATLAGDGVHPNDHVNMGQSSNDVFPSAVHLAALDQVTATLLPAMEALAGELGGKADEFADLVKAGRTHMMDAVPVTLGQEFAGYEAQVRLGIERISATLDRVGQTLDEIDRTVGSTDEARVGAARTLEELERTLKALRNLVDYVQTHPEAVVLGKEKGKEK